MADSILRLKLDSREYEANIKRATEGLLQMEKECRSLGGVLAYLDEDQRAFVNALGRMETKSGSARGKVAELSKAYEDLRAQYNRLTDEEKRGDYGKALSASLGQLRDRLKEGKGELREFGEETKTGGGVLDALKDKFGLGIGKITAWGAALGVAKTAMEALKTGVANNESMMDEWGRTVEASQSVWRAFCNDLVNGDFGGFFSSMDKIVAAAREAYDALDALETKGGVISNAEARYNASRAEYLKVLKDPKATDEQKRKARAGLAEIKSQRAGAVQETQGLNNQVIRTAIMQRLKEGGVSDADAKKYYPLIVRSLYDTKAVNQLDGTTVSYARYRYMASDPGGPNIGQEVRLPDRVINLGDLFGDDFRNERLNPYVRAYWGARQRQYTDERTDNRLSGTGGGSGATAKKNYALEHVREKFQIEDLRGWDEDQYQKEEARIRDYYNRKYLLTEKYQKEFDEKWAKMSLREKSAMLNGGQDLPLFEDVDKNPFKHTDKFVENQLAIAEKWYKSAKKGTEQWKLAANAVSQVGAAMQGIKDPVLNVMGIVMQAVATVALSYTMALKDAAKLGPWVWVAFAATGLATMMSVISSIKSATAGSYASGGVVGGSNYSDGLTARVSTGEVIFNRTDAAKLYDYVHSSSSLGGGEGSLRLVTEVSGSNLRLVLNNDGRRRGVGKVIS